MLFISSVEDISTIGIFIIISSSITSKLILNLIITLDFSNEIISFFFSIFLLSDSKILSTLFKKEKYIISLSSFK